MFYISVDVFGVYLDLTTTCINHVFVTVSLGKNICPMSVIQCSFYFADTSCTQTEMKKVSIQCIYQPKNFQILLMKAG